MARSAPLLEAWLRRGTHRIEPAADVNLGVSFSAVVPGAGGVSDIGIPTEHGKVGIPTSDDEPVDGIASYDPADLTSVFLQSCHGFFRDPALLTSRSRPVRNLA
jgi:hypothetical protein